MQQGKNIVELAQDLQDSAAAKRDMVVDTRSMQLRKDDDTNSYKLGIEGQGEFDVSGHAHSQLAARLGIPKKYYERMMTEAPELLEDNVDHWFQTKPESRMVRTLNGQARAFLSNRYRRIDNEQIAEAVLPALLESSDDVQIFSSNVTEKRLYIEARFPKLEGDVKLNDPVQGGVIITNSEIGLGALDIRPVIYRLVCLNGMITKDNLTEGRLRQQHVGRQVAGGEDFTLYSDETRIADDHALMLKIRDSIKALSDPKAFFELMERMKLAASSTIIENPMAAVEVLQDSFALSSGEYESVLTSLIKDDDYSRWGMLNAVTKQANDNEDYDRAIELQEIGGKILNMNQIAWQEVALAA